MRLKASRSYICTGPYHPQAVASSFSIQVSPKKGIAVRKKNRLAEEWVFTSTFQKGGGKVWRIRVSRSPIGGAGGGEHASNQSASLCVEVRRRDWLSHTGRWSYRGSRCLSGMGEHKRLPDPPSPMPTGRVNVSAWLTPKSLRKLMSQTGGTRNLDCKEMFFLRTLLLSPYSPREALKEQQSQS